MMYVLLESIENNFSEPRFFTDHAAAIREMDGLISEAFDVTPEAVSAARKAPETSDELFEFSEDCAWGERHDTFFNWEIKSVEGITFAADGKVGD